MKSRIGRCWVGDGIKLKEKLLKSIEIDMK